MVDIFQLKFFPKFSAVCERYPQEYSGSWRCSRQEWVKVDAAWLSLSPLPVRALLGVDLAQTPEATPRPRAPL